MKDKGNNSLPTKGNYSISLEEIKSLNFFDYLEAIGASLSKKSLPSMVDTINGKTTLYGSVMTTKQRNISTLTLPVTIKEL